MYSKLKNQLSPYGVLIAGLALVTLITILGGLWHYNQEVASQIAKKDLSISASVPGISQSQTKSLGSSADSDSASNSTNTTPGSKISAPATKSATQGSGSQTASSAPSRQANVRVSLSVNGYAKGVVSLPAGSNQCDLLTQALANHLLSNLDMRYSSQYKTQGVYVIDGIGDPGSVWWTYKVNGSAPPYGCAGMIVRDGDSVNWQYVKS